MFCPKCGSEFEAEYTRCAECETDLVEALPADEEEYTELVTVYEGEEGPADLVRAKLESCGIEAWVQTALAGLLLGSVGGTTVRVRAEDALAACEALAEVVPVEDDVVVDSAEDPGEEA